MVMKLDLTEIAGIIGKSYHYEIKVDCFETDDVRWYQAYHRQYRLY